MNDRFAGTALAFVLALAFIVAPTAASAAASWDADLPASLDAMASSAWQPSLLTAFGTFTYEDTGLPSPFSRYLEDSLKAAITRSSRLRLFNKSVASAMDSAFREAYGDFFRDNSVDALLAGRYYVEGRELRARLELTGLADGVLIGTLDIRIPLSSLPRGLAVDPSRAATVAATSLGRIDPEAGKGSLKVSVSTDRGAGAVYRDGEQMAVLVTVNKPAYLKVYHIDVEGRVQLIWPNAFSPSRRIEAGSIVRIPGPNDPFAFAMVPPYGTDFIKVIASNEPFAADESASAGTSAFAELGGNAREAISRGLALVGASDQAERAEAMASYVIVGK